MAVISEHGSSTEELSLKEQNEKNLKNIGTVPEFFAHKNIFITGGTGFLGTVLIEELLDTHPDIGTIYVLVRGKRKFDPNERISRLLQKPIFQKFNEKTLAKVVPVVGELSEVNFGFSEVVLNELIDKVNVIYHSAATIKFSSPLRTAIKTNLTGTMRTIELAKKLKNLSAYVYFSTAFCNSNNRGLIVEEVYKSQFDPYEMMKIAEDDAYWEDFTDEKCKEIIRDHPNTYTFTKNLSENLLIAEMPGLPAAIVRPSIVYGTWEHPMKGWVGNANSGHLGYLAGFVKGLFRTMCGRAASVIDIIPCDFVISSSLVMGWYVGTHPIEQPEVIHCTSGELNPLTLSEFCVIMNESVKRHPPNNFVWKPHTKLRNGWRYNLFFYLFHILPAIAYGVPEKLFGVGMPQHTALEYMRVFHKGTKAFDYFLDKDFRYSLKNALRIMSLMHESDKKRYNFDSSQCDWSEFIDRCLIGVRRFYFKEAAETTEWHHMYWTVFNIIHYAGFAVLFLFIFVICGLLFGLTIGLALALAIWGFLVWL
ncbi:PREDICTED: putative fatty acyl-CoA reductase CG8303 [Rhagoletis zephyria]|uniref:putative fatty acyl-CoA reductase CG8303 n=1 Tax=Rhagoletis zephyria TaxID=28612 RepID=UPI00081183AB|nr:PREDICTED: putative fatty acyl-CoA reductase CG8303 [Rhagoletis zephyria]XP_017466465.1 PREDICTED: putative fatty acyl-CoA reductase CG8303 [Rhagoletis zephyria]XP_017466473.1 PREDICTED: putative fatty acyl-CoA reductase CG8303 [Rhagoletis zephyria]XP_017466480.1 PREDICTED: putative fatty acyl-CoA reductase CG8303 [Rhagoletis zephyria]XP_036333981.1 putative fatty acyl-CoA reductase CG8303 [Rhagoletis pomonella]XP_036333982.1 putative fatty acyl-CoA reductase CG8303 [Rhagoletis pomonella]X